MTLGAGPVWMSGVSLPNISTADEQWKARNAEVKDRVVASIGVRALGPARQAVVGACQAAFPRLARYADAARTADQTPHGASTVGKRLVLPRFVFKLCLPTSPATISQADSAGRFQIARTSITRKHAPVYAYDRTAVRFAGGCRCSYCWAHSFCSWLSAGPRRAIGRNDPCPGFGCQVSGL
jgi:hypothetical protein